MVFSVTLRTWNSGIPRPAKISNSNGLSLLDNIKNLRVIYCRKQFDVINYVTFRWMMCGFMQLATLQFERKLQKCIRMGITIFKISFGEVYHWIYCRKPHFTVQLVCQRKSKFPAVYRTIYLP